MLRQIFGCVGLFASTLVTMSALCIDGVRGQDKKGGGPKHVFAGMPTAHPFDVILARPTDKSVTVSVMAYKDVTARISYGTASGKLDKQTNDRPLNKGELSSSC
jgi:hypothetical protein